MVASVTIEYRKGVGAGIEGTCGPIFGSCLVNSDGRSNGISPSPIAFAIFLHSVLRRTMPRTIFPTPSSLIGLVRPLLLLLNPPFRSPDPIYFGLPLSFSSRRVDFPSLEVFQSTTLCRTLFLRELSELLSPQSGCANTAYNTLWFSVTMNRGPRPNYKRLRIRRFVSLTSVCLRHSQVELLARKSSAGDWHFVCRKSDSGDDPRCSSSAATAEGGREIYDGADMGRRDGLDCERVGRRESNRSGGLMKAIPKRSRASALLSLSEAKTNRELLMVPPVSPQSRTPSTRSGSAPTPSRTRGSPPSRSSW